MNVRPGSKVIRVTMQHAVQTGLNPLEHFQLELSGSSPLCIRSKRQSVFPHKKHGQKWARQQVLESEHTHRGAIHFDVPP